MPKKRNLASERNDLQAEYESPARSDETMSKFASLYVEALQHEKDSTQWTALSELFPRDVRLLAMKMEDVHKKLKLTAPHVEIWAADVRLQVAEKKLGDHPGKPELQEAVEACTCQFVTALTEYVTAIKPKPASLTEFRQALNTVSDCHTQAKLFKKMRLTMSERFPEFFPADCKENFTLFMKGLSSEVLYAKLLGDPTIGTRKAYYDYVKPLADKLHAAIVAQGALDECDKYPTLVQHRVLGELQFPLVKALAGRIPMPEIRAAAGALKDELCPDVETDTRLRVINYLSHKKMTPGSRTPEVLRRELVLLPGKLILNAIKTADGTPRALKKNISDLLLQIHPPAARRTIRAYGFKMVQAAPKELRRTVGLVFDDYMAGRLE